MRACYPGPVGGDNLVSPFGFLSSGPRLGQFCHGCGSATRWQVSRGDTGATQDMTRRVCR